MKKHCQSRAQEHCRLFNLIILAAALVCSGCIRQVSTQHSTSETFNIELYCGHQTPGENTELARLIDYAEQHEGQLAHVTLEFYPDDCNCEQTTENVPFDHLKLICSINTEWWLAKRMEQYHCVEALGLAGYGAGVGSICFPSYASLPLKIGYTRELTATHETISGDFLLDWEWGLGAPHVVLLIPE